MNHRICHCEEFFKIKMIVGAFNPHGNKKIKYIMTEKY